jgi:molybdate transport system substrate-binding protein
MPNLHKKDNNPMTSIITIVLFIVFSTTIALGQITVACAANVQFAMEEIKAAYEKSNGHINVVYGSSGKLTTQIKNGAPFDIFVSADADFPDSLYAAHAAITQPKIYAYGKLVLWTLDDALPLDGNLQCLKNSDISSIAVPDPKRAPYGREAIKALAKAGILSDVQSRLVYGESISQAADYVLSKAAGVGFNAKSIVLAPKMKDKGKWVEVDSSLYDRIAQAAVVLQYGKDNNPTASQKFYAFLFSPVARTLFTKYGYILP